jgi:hypothetical protein
LGVEIFLEAEFFSPHSATSDFRHICNRLNDHALTAFVSSLSLKSTSSVIFNHIYQSLTVQRLFILSTFHFLIFSPCIINKQGTGIIASAKKASNEFPQPSPKALYIFGPASGRTAAITDLVSVLAASAEAA